MSANRSEAFPAMPVVPDFWYKLSSEESNEVLYSFMRTLLDRLSEAAWGRAGLDILAGIACNDVPYLCDFDPFILDLSPADQSVIRQCLAFFSKRADIDIGVDRQDAASRKFEAAERSCALTNQCFRAWSQGRFQFTPSVEAVLHSAQRKISDLLGPVPRAGFIRPRFGPGASTATPKKNSCPAVKLKNGIQCSTNFPDTLLEGIVAGDFNPAVRNVGDLVEVGIHLSRVSFVAKNAKTDRAICVEPMLNSMWQNGLGDWVAARLRRVGIDIRDQSANQRAALYGSISNVSATLDLSSASDTVAKGLVEHLLSSDWYDLLLGLSTREGVVGGKMTYFEKISSMGNGFTFPLETLVFWALTQAAKDLICPNHRVRVLVYGDDIIAPVPCVPLLREALTALGFTLNSSKSFWDGPFRESCGCDYVLGENVRPVYIKDSLSGEDFYRIRNFFYRANDFVSARFWEDRIDPHSRLYGPDGFGDGHLVVSDYRPFLKPGSYAGSFRFSTHGRRPKSLNAKMASSIAERIEYLPMEWCPKSGRWVRARRKLYGRVYKAQHEVLVRQLATYTAFRNEERVLTLTPSDRLRSEGTHVYADRRMPDPLTSCDEDFFVVPGSGKGTRTNIYIFESS